MNALLGIDRIAEATPWLVEARPWREDPLAIEETVRGFFDAFNSMDYDRCLRFTVVGAGDKGRLHSLLRLARYFSGTVEVQHLANLTINGAKASAIVSATVRGEPTKEEVKLVREGFAWKLLWDGAPTHRIALKANGSVKNDSRGNKRPKK